jgi:hypothetical protein
VRRFQFLLIFRFCSVVGDSLPAVARRAARAKHARERELPQRRKQFVLEHDRLIGGVRSKFTASRKEALIPMDILIAFRWRGFFAPALLVGFHWLVASTLSAGATTEPAVATNVLDVRGISEPLGGKALISYTVRHDVNSHIDPGTPLPGARIASADHAQDFSGAYGDSVFAGAWLSPQSIIQLNPTSQLYENTYFFDQVQNKDAFGVQQGVAMEAGDHVELAMENVTEDAPMFWDAPRGTASGHLTWDVAQDSRNVTASYGAVTGDMDAIFVRADIVARGGDVDARNQDVATDTLVIDLPRIYAASTTGAYIITTFFPAAQYVTTMRMRVEPELGKVFLEATVQGYIPAANEYTLPSGAQIKEWHLPLNVVIMIKPTGGLTGNVSVALPAGGRAVAGVDDQIKQLDVRAGGRVIATSAGSITLLPDDAASQSDTDVSSATVNQAALAAAAAINHSTSAPVDLTAGDYSVTIDPDFRGQGVLAVKSLRRLLTGSPYADVLAVPFVLIDGAPATLDRSRLVDLRVYPDYRWATVQFTGYGETDLPARTHTVFGSAFRPGLVVQAVYDLGDDRYAFVPIIGAHFIDTPGSISVRATVISLATGRRVTSAPVEYLEIPFSGSIIYAGETKISEFSAPLGPNFPNANLVLGQRSFIGSITDGEVTVVGAPGPLTVLPQPSGASLDGRPAALYYTHSPTATSTPSGASFAVARLDSDFTPPPQPKPIGEQCSAPEIDDGAAPDAAPALDVKSAWFDVDDANLYACIKVTDLPATSPSGSTYSWAMHWRNQHSTRYARAIVDSSGQFSFEFGLYNVNPALPSYTKQTDVTGDYQIGADGIVRIWIPRSLLGYQDGDLLRDTSARSQITTNDETLEIDQAPNGSSPMMGTGGDYLLTKCGSTATATLRSVVSRKSHGGSATFDIDLPLTGSTGIECRSGANGDDTLVFTFANTLTNVGGASVTSGTGFVSSSNIDSTDAHNYIVNLTGVANAQLITVSLTNVNDSAGNASSAVSVSMGVLLGDVNGNGIVSNTDVAAVKAEVAAPVTTSNFRNDVNISGVISNTDVSTTKAQVGTTLP